MSEIPLTQGRIALVDDEDYEQLARHSWSFDGRGYAVRGVWVAGRVKKVRMHRQILSAAEGVEVDHVNGNGLDNRRSNLRLCEHHQNARNVRPRQGCTSQYKGVYWHRQSGKWRARLRFGGKHISLGLYVSEQDAARAYDAAARQHFGAFARTNFEATDAR